jgi:hypothetical protein
MEGGRRGNGISEGVEGAAKVEEGDRVEMEKKSTAKRGEKVEGGVRGSEGSRDEAEKNEGVTIDGNGGRRGERGEGVKD